MERNREVLRQYMVTITVRESSSAGSITLTALPDGEGEREILSCTGPSSLSVLDMIVDEIVKCEVGIGITDDEGWLE